MELRLGRNGWFYGCMGFKEGRACSKSISLAAAAAATTATGASAPAVMPTTPTAEATTTAAFFDAAEIAQFELDCSLFP